MTDACNPDTGGDAATMTSPGAESTSLASDLRGGVDAFIATALGTLGGILVDSGFRVRDALLRPAYLLLGPLFDLFSRFPNVQLLIAEVVDRVPVVLIVGLALGLLLRKLRYPRMLLYATVIWPLCVVARGSLSLAFGGLVSTVVIYTLQYAALILTIRGVHRLVSRGTAAR